MITFYHTLGFQGATVLVAHAPNNLSSAIRVYIISTGAPDMQHV